MKYLILLILFSICCVANNDFEYIRKLSKYKLDSADTFKELRNINEIYPDEITSDIDYNADSATISFSAKTVVKIESFKSLNENSIFINFPPIFTKNEMKLDYKVTIKILEDSSSSVTFSNLILTDNGISKKVKKYHSEASLYRVKSELSNSFDEIEDYIVDLSYKDEYKLKFNERVFNQYFFNNPQITLLAVGPEKGINIMNINIYKKLDLLDLENKANDFSVGFHAGFIGVIAAWFPTIGLQTDFQYGRFRIEYSTTYLMENAYIDWKVTQNLKLGFRLFNEVWLYLGPSHTIITKLENGQVPSGSRRGIFERGVFYNDSQGYWINYEIRFSPF